MFDASLTLRCSIVFYFCTYFMQILCKKRIFPSKVNIYHINLQAKANLLIPYQENEKYILCFLDITQLENSNIDLIVINVNFLNSRIFILTLKCKQCNAATFFVFEAV